MNLEHLLRFVERLDWKLILSLQFSWRTKKAGGSQKRWLLFKRKKADQRIILVYRSFKRQEECPVLPPDTPDPSLHFFKQNRYLCRRFFLLA